MKKFLPISSLILVLIVAVGESFPQDMPPTQVVTAPVQKIRFHDQITLVGRTQASIQSQIPSEVSAQVEAIVALEGNSVQKGDPLVQMDTTRIALSLESQRAQANQAKAGAELAANIKEKAEELWDKKLISEIRIDSVRALYAVAQERYNQLLAEQKRLELDLADCTIRAPFAGYTGKQLTSVGQWVDEGTPVFELTNLAKVKIDVDLPERHFGHVGLGSQVIVYVSGDEERPLKGIVTGLTPNASEETHTFPVMVIVDNAEGRLGSGMLVRAVLALKETFFSLAVPKDAIVRQGNQSMVYTINDGKAAPIPVTTSATDGNLVAVTGAGLTEGMAVVVRGNERIFPGSPVMTSDGSQQNDPAPKEKAKTK